MLIPCRHAVNQNQGRDGWRVRRALKAYQVVMLLNLSAKRGFLDHQIRRAFLFETVFPHFHAQCRYVLHLADENPGFHS